MVRLYGREYKAEKIGGGLIRLTAYTKGGGPDFLRTIDDVMEGSLTAFKHYLGFKAYAAVVTELAINRQSKSK